MTETRERGGYHGPWIALLLVPLVLGLGACRDITTELQTYMDKVHDLWRFEGAVLVAYDGHVILSRGYGMANHDLDIPNTPTTKFFIGSITKQFTAAAVLRLQEQGLLNIDDPISRYLPFYPKNTGEKITIRHLMSHTSGLPNYTDKPEVALRRMNQLTPEEIMLTFMYEPLDFEPGTQFAYSNSGYIVLGAIIERVSGQSYEAFLHHEIFKPSGMSNSGYARREAGLPDRADGYTIETEGELVSALPMHFSILHTAGALYSTVEDMLKWDKALRSDTPLSHRSVEMMFTPNQQGYAFGWFVERLYNRRHAFHGGFLDGFNTTFDRWLDDKLCVVVFSNDDDAPVKKIARGLAAIVFGEPHMEPLRKESISTNQDRLVDYEGVYEESTTDSRFVTTGDNCLYTHLLGNPPERLLPEARDTFFFATDNTVVMTFRRDSTNRVCGYDIENDGLRITGTRLSGIKAASLLINRESVALDSSMVARYAGEYALQSHTGINRDDFILRITARKDRLLATIGGSTPIELFPSSETEFFHRLADYCLTFIVNGNNVTGCVMRLGPAEVHGARIE